MNPPPLTPKPASSHSGLATASLVCGILAIPTCFTTALPAIIMGHIAWSKSAAGGSAPGRAKLGLIFGYGSLALIPVIAALAGLTAPLIIRQRHKADQTECVNHVRQIGLALVEYQAVRGNFPPDLRQLEAEGITINLDELLSLRATHDGEWLYFPQANREEPTAPLLISPPIDKQSVVLRVDQSVRLEAKADPSATTPEEGNPPIRIPVPLRVAR